MFFSKYKKQQIEYLFRCDVDWIINFWKKIMIKGHLQGQNINVGVKWLKMWFLLSKPKTSRIPRFFKKKVYRPDHLTY